jgi:hypothetical protein
MNPVDLINHPLRHSDIDYGFWPSSYWEPPAAVLAAVLRNVKGTERRTMIRDYFKQGRLDELLPEFTCDELSEVARKRLGRIHPSFMGGEYLTGAPLRDKVAGTYAYRFRDGRDPNPARWICESLSQRDSPNKSQRMPNARDPEVSS